MGNKCTAPTYHIQSFLEIEVSIGSMSRIRKPHAETRLAGYENGKFLPLIGMNVGRIRLERGQYSVEIFLVFRIVNSAVFDVIYNVVEYCCQQHKLY